MNIPAKFSNLASIALALIMLVQSLSASAFAQTTNTRTISPSKIQVSDAELVNPMRGFHEWRGMETVPQPETSTDSYQRYNWRHPEDPSRSLETSRGNYNFSEIDADIAAAAAKGQKFAFRIRAMGNDSGGMRYIPDYLSGCGWSYRGTFIPNWNASCFQDNARNLINALGNRYNNDPRIAWIEIGMYGRWGEWAMAEDIYDSAPSGISVISDSNMQRIVDMHLNAFPNVRKIMFVKTRPAAVIHALSSSSQVGWRIDCLGKEGYFDFATNPNYRASWSYMEERWKTAPVIVEFCANDVDPTYSTAIDQVRDYHIAAIGNGNIDSWSGKSSSQRSNLTLLGKTAGYRFHIKNVTVPDSWARGSNIAIATQWENLGVTPHYESTSVTFKLYNPGSSSYVWSAGSSVNLKNLLPTGNTPVTINDNLSLPSSLASGTYQLRVIVTDPRGYRRPLRLATTGRQSDGSYLLGSVTVTGGSTNPSTPAPTTPPPSNPGGVSATYNPIADTYVSGDAASSSFGNRTTIRTNKSPTEISYMRFDLRNLAGANISSAVLRVRITNAAGSSTVQTVRAVDGDSWDESTLNFNNRPSLSSTVHGSFHGGEYGTWAEVDLTGLIQSRRGSVFSLAIDTNDSDAFAYYTRETNNKPQLNVVYSSSSGPLAPQPTNTPVPPPAASEQNASFNPVADTYVASQNASNNYGDRTTLRANESPDEIAYMRFNLNSLAGKTITQATLRVRVTNAAGSITRQYVRTLVNNSWWEEASLNFTNRPELESGVHGSFHGGSYGEWVEVDLTDLIRTWRGDVFSLAIVTNDTDSFAFYSRESGDKPQLNVIYH